MTRRSQHLHFLNLSLHIPSPVTPPLPRFCPPGLYHLPGERGHLHQTQNACHPPVAGHDNSASHPAALVVVRPRVVPSQRLADPLAVGVAATALGAAHALVVQHGVDVHGALLALETSLRGDREDSHKREHSVASHSALWCCGSSAAENARFKPIKNGFPTGRMGRRRCCQMWVFVVKYFPLQCCACCLPPSVVVRSVCFQSPTVFLTPAIKRNMMTLAPLCLLLFWMLPVDSTAVSGACEHRWTEKISFYMI